MGEKASIRKLLIEEFNTELERISQSYENEKMEIKNSLESAHEIEKAEIKAIYEDQLKKMNEAHKAEKMHIFSEFRKLLQNCNNPSFGEVSDLVGITPQDTKMEAI